MLTMETKNKTYAAITCDVIGSRTIEGFRRKRDQKLRQVSELHVDKNWILSEYAVTAWDEFQGILSVPANIPAVVFDLRGHFHPLRLRIGIGIGHLTEPHRKPVNVFAGGEAFERAREAINSLTRGNAINRLTKSADPLTSFFTGIETFDLIANTVYLLHDTLLQSISAQQWQTINVQMGTNRPELTARKLGLAVRG